MKSLYTTLALSAFLLFIPGHNGSYGQTHLDFHGSLLYNPVLIKGDAGQWDESFIFLPYAFKHDGTFYLYYTGWDNGGTAAIGMATSTDGYTFGKYSGNPVLKPSAIGFDSYFVANGIVLEDTAGWLMYYNARELSGGGPGPAIGRATAPGPEGPWTKSAGPVLVTGGPGEWDAGCISPNSVLHLSPGGHIMFYYGATDFFSSSVEIGMAMSPDGITWTKYDDPATTDPPYAESDPVLKVGETPSWDDWSAMECSVLYNNGYFEMYYKGVGYSAPSHGSIGYAWSTDGVTWIKDTDNPVFTHDDDEYAVDMGFTYLEQPSVIIDGPIAFMYYDYGSPYPGEIGMARSPAVAIPSAEEGNRHLRIYPNPTSGVIYIDPSEELSQQELSVAIHNLQGQLVYEQTLPAGEKKINVRLPDGIYLLTIQAGKMVQQELVTIQR